MNTIPRGADEVDTSDSSTQGRVHFWRVAVQMANANPLTGIGHNAYNQVYDRYDFSNGAYGHNRSVHSSWFGVLAELGYPGLMLLGAMILNAYFTSRRAQRLAKKHAELKDLAAFAGGIEAALVAFAVGGSFVIMQYTELLWHLLALSIVVGRLVDQRVKSLAVAPQPAAIVSPTLVAAGLPRLAPARRARA